MAVHGITTMRYPSCLGVQVRMLSWLFTSKEERQTMEERSAGAQLKRTNSNASLPTSGSREHTATPAILALPCRGKRLQREQLKRRIEHSSYTSLPVHGSRREESFLCFTGQTTVPTQLATLEHFCCLPCNPTDKAMQQKDKIELERSNLLIRNFTPQRPLALALRPSRGWCP